MTTAGSGTVAKSPDQPSYDYGTTVTLTAAPGTGYHFASWSGDTATATNPLTLVMTRNRSLTATFAINTYTLTVTTSGSGTVAKSPNQSSYDYGTVVTLTATPGVGNRFVGWSGAVSSTANPTTVVMDADKSVTATFLITTYTLTVTTVGSGTVTKAPDQSSYDYGTSVTLTASGAANHHFVGWSGDTTTAASSVALVMTRDRSLTATFAIDTYTLTVMTTGSGTVAKSPDLPSYDYGTVVTLTAAPGVGYQFVGWSGALSGTANPTTVLMDAGKSVTATFTISTYTLTVTTSGNGTVAKSPDLPSYGYGTVVTLTATPAGSYQFVGWSGAVSGAANPTTVTMDSDKSVTATFAATVYSLTIQTIGSGTVAPTPPGLSYGSGTVVTITASPAVGWHFVSWSGDASGTAGTTTVTMDADRSVTATFAIDTYSLTVTTTGSGTVARIPDQPSYDYGSLLTLTATPSTGYEFVNWSGDASGTANPTTVTMDSDKSVTATFAVGQYALTVTVAGSGTVTKTPDQPLYEYGTEVTLTAVPGPGWLFVGWSGDSVVIGDTLVVTMNASRQVTATFAMSDTPVVAVVAPNGGEVAVVGFVLPIRWIAAATAGVASVDVLLYREGLGSAPEVLASGIANSGRLDWVLTGPASTDAFVRVVARDSVGNLGTDASDDSFTIQSSSTAVENGAVADFALSPIAPNPAIGMVRIGFAVAREARVRLTVLDVLGREVASPAEGVYPAGRYQVVWGAGGRDGGAAAGIYFVRYQAAGRVFTRKVIIAR